MNKQQLERLLNTACEIITDLEDIYYHYCKNNEDMSPYEEMDSRIESLFNEIKYSDELDADMEAQDWDTFGENKI